MKINKFGLEIAHCILARDYKGFGNESNGVLIYPAKVVKPYGSIGGIGGVKFKENEKGKKIFVFDGIEVDNQTFNKLRKYIMYQNLPDYKDDSWVDKAIRKDQEERQKLMSKG